VNFDKVKAEAIADEGIKTRAYKCTSGKWTVGIGFNFQDVDFPAEVIDLLFETSYIEVYKDLHKVFPDLKKLPEELHHVLFNMRFQLGHGGFRNFKKMIDAVNRLDLSGMIREMKDSDWYRDKYTHGRAERLVNRVEKLLRG